MLVSIATYRQFTRDASTDDAVVLLALGSAQAIIEAAIDRHLDFAEYTETMPAGIKEWIPRALPVTAITGDVLTLAPERMSVVRGEVTAYGDLPGPWWGDVSTEPTVFTYHGGFVTEADVPPRLLMEWCNLARQLIRDDESRNDRPPTWASQIANGDVSVMVRADAGSTYVADMRELLYGFRRQ